MLQTLKKFFDFCGEDNRRMFIASIWLGVVSAICSAMRIPAAAIVIQALLERNVTMATLWTSLGIIVISLIITIAINMKSTMLQTRAGYRACANKRIEIAEHLRYLPMGWFNDNSLGEVTSVTTNTMENMANVATRVVMVTTRGFLTSIDCQASATASKKTSKGVRQPRRLRGLRLIRSRTRSNSACDTSRKLQPRGKKYRSSPLAFSLQPRCHGLCGSAKKMGALSCSSNSRNSANSDPLSRDRLFIGLSFSASTIAFLVSLACLE